MATRAKRSPKASGRLRSARRTPATDEKLISDSAGLAIEDEAYARLEQEFMSRGLARYASKQASWAEALKVATTALQRFDGPRSRIDPAIFALDALGLAALRPEPWEETTELGPETLRETLRRVRALIWQRIGRWYEVARRGRSQKERKQAAANLKRVGTILAGDRRGLGRATITNPGLAYMTYRQRLFRLKRLEACWSRRRSSRPPRTAVCQWKRSSSISG